MKKTTTFIALWQMLHLTAVAQVTFPAGTNLCESTPWKLVWYDEFDGTTINTDKWFTFLDDNNWGPNGVIVPPVSQESRTMNRGSNFLDANVTVSGGTCKLTAKYQPNTWINSYKQYTSGLIKAKQSGANYPMYFNKGRFEMKARITKAEKTWAAYWLWQAGGHTGGNSEIDMFEYMPTNDANENTYSLHGWERTGASSNPTTVTGSFSYSNINAWHTYVCEWDNDFVRIYMDNQLKYEGSRYTLVNSPNTSSGCQPTAGAPYVNDVHRAFPFTDESMSLICSMDYRDNIGSNMPDGVFEIDYIRVYQRTPQPALKDLCSYVSGPNNICLNVPTTYYASIGEGIFTGWTVSSNIQIISTGNTSGGQPYVTVKGVGNGTAWVSANVQGAPSSCSPSMVRIEAGVGLPPSPSVTLHPTSLPQKKNIKFTFSAPPSGTTYEWSTLKVFSSQPPVYGANAGTSIILLTEGEIAGYTIKAINNCGTSDYRFDEFKLENGVLVHHEPLRPANPDDAPDVALNSENLTMDLFPNPTNGQLQVTFGKPVERAVIIISDLQGRLLYNKEYKGAAQSRLSLDISSYARGMYYVEIRVDGEQPIRRKITKE